MLRLLNPMEMADCGQDTPCSTQSDVNTVPSSPGSSSTSSPSMSPTSTPRRKAPARPSALSSSSARTPATSSAARPSACSSPPGFHPQPQFCNAIVKQKRPEINVTVGNVYSEPFRPLIANTETYSNVFNDADLQPTSNAEIHALLAADPT